MIEAACGAYRRALLSGEGDGAHAGACEGCRRFAERERETVELVRRNRPDWRAPLELRERIVAAIDAARAHEPRRPWWPRRAIVGGIAVALAVAATWLLWPRSDARARADELADQIVGDHLEYAQRADKAQIASASAAELEAWYAREVKLAATVPELNGARIVGGRHCHLGDRSVALTFFDLGGTPLSLFVFEPRGEDWSKLDAVASLPGKKKACRHERRGVALLVWQERGLDYVLAGAVEAEQLVELVR